jgi:hypothetical protein
VSGLSVLVGVAKCSARCLFYLDFFTDENVTWGWDVTSHHTLGGGVNPREGHVSLPWAWVLMWTLPASLFILSKRIKACLGPFNLNRQRLQTSSQRMDFWRLLIQQSFSFVIKILISWRWGRPHAFLWEKICTVKYSTIQRSKIFQWQVKWTHLTRNRLTERIHNSLYSADFIRRLPSKKGKQNGGS